MTDDKNSFLNESGKSGLILAAVAVAYFVLTFLLGKTNLSGFASSALSLVLWAIKFWLCIHLLVKFLRTEAGRNGKDRSRTFRFGMMVSLCSALVYAAAYLFFVIFIAPDTFSTIFDTMAQTSSFTSEQMDQMANMESSMPAISFFVNLIWCWLFGTIVSAIASGNICGSSNPFEE